MTDRGFDLADRVAALDDATPRDLSPTDRVAERAHFAPDPGGDLPVLDSTERLVFASNNYLGLTTHQRVENAARRAAAVVGTGAGSSRLATGDTMVHRDLERLLAEATETDRTLCFPSGYVARSGAVAALAPDVVFCDEATDAGVLDGCRLADADLVPYDHCDATALRTAMEACDVDGSWLVVTDTVFWASGDVAPLEAVCDVAADHGAWVLADESHATGLYADGVGIVQSEGLEDRVNVRTGSLSTALASQGGWVAGSDDLVEYLTYAARPFAYSAGLSPPAAAAASEALHLARYGSVREDLWRNVRHLRSGLEDLGFEVGGESQILSVRVTDAADARHLAAELYEERVVTTPVLPPAVPDEVARVRVTPMATHCERDVLDCLDAFASARETVGLL